MPTQVITFRINPDIKKYFQSLVFKHRFGQMPELLRQALFELSEDDLPVARKYANGARFGKNFSKLEIDESAPLVTYSVNIDSRIKAKIENSLSQDKDVKSAIKSISNFCRCVCEHYVYKLHGNHDPMTPELTANPLILGNLVKYIIVIRHHFEKHTVDVFVPGLPANDYMAMDVSVIRPNHPTTESVAEQNRTTIVEELKQNFVDKLTEALIALPAGEKPVSHQLQGMVLGDNCDTFEISFDLSKLEAYKDNLEQSATQHNKKALRVDFSVENADYLESLPNYNQVLNDLVNQYRKKH